MLSQALLAAAVGAPVGALLAALVPGWRGRLPWLLPVAPLPALVAALLVAPGTSLELPWLMLGGQWALDDTRRALLAAMALVWCVGGLTALRSPITADRLRHLVLPWLFTLTGNLWLALAQDIGGFYSGFAMMSFGAYALVVCSGSTFARDAGRLYIAFTVLGEMAILAGLLLASRGGAGNTLALVPAAIADSPHVLGITLALLVGFGVKAALLGVHFWLPSTYTVAPAAVRVVLGGAMINAGVLGWLLTLPLGVATLPTLGRNVAIVGLVAAYWGAFRGVRLGDSATVLGWSSISQSGLVTVLVGAALASGEPGFVAVLTLYAVHHGIAKGALFTGSDDTVAMTPAARRWLLLPALALAGAPLTSGAAAKLAMKSELGSTELAWIVPWLSAAAIGTTLLVARVLWCAERLRGEAGVRAFHGALMMAAYREGLSPAEHERESRAIVSRNPPRVGPAWPIALVAVATGVWWIPLSASLDAGLGDVLALGWPIVAGVLLAALGWNRLVPRPTGVVRLQPTAPAPVSASTDARSGTSGGSSLANRDADAESDSVSERYDTVLRRTIPLLLGALLLLVAAALVAARG